MSDPIRSISQNNYLLAAQQEVSHDNTLSGNGTEASPLGLNETVLWSGDAPNPMSSIILSESCKNFDMIRVHWTGWVHTSVHGEIVSEIVVNRDNKIVLEGGWIGNSTRGFTIAEYEVNSYGTEFTLVSLGFSNFTGQWYNVQTDTGPSILKVVGINRIANN